MQAPNEATHTAIRWSAITKSDTVRLEPVPVAIFVGGGGDIAAEGQDGVSATFTVAAGTVLQIQPGRILSTGTSATNIVGLHNR